MTRTSEPTVYPPRPRRIFCNRTLNLRAIRAIGYDMDYTLVHYRVEPWERRAFEYMCAKLATQGWPVGDLAFDPDLLTRGLIIDAELGNVLKANRFGYVIRASHGTRPLDFEQLRRAYGRTLVDLGERRYVFLNTLFSLSEGCAYLQLVDRLDAGALPGAMGYADLYDRVRRSADEAHFEGALKAEITADPERYVERDDELVLALTDQRESGKKLMLITNSDWGYTDHMLTFAIDPAMPKGARWRDLFDLVIVDARKPDFFSRRMPLFEVATEEGLLRACPGGIRKSGMYAGGDAHQVEEWLGVSGEEILYVGDHIYTDVTVTKAALRWRTALILRELEDEVAAVETFKPQQAELSALMREKVQLEFDLSQTRLALQRRLGGYGPRAAAPADALREQIAALRARLIALDERIAPVARHAGDMLNPRWGLLMRAGNDKSHLARQVERSADIYTSRVSNFLVETPFAYLRAPRGSLAHDEDQSLV